MRRYAEMILPLVTLIAAAGAAGEASAAVRSYPVSPFDRVEVAGPFTVNVVTGKKPVVRATGADQALERLTVEVRGRALVIGSKPGNWGWTGNNMGKVIVTVGVPLLRGAKLTGSGDLTVDRVRGPAFDLALTGSGDATVGMLETDNLALSLTGSGDVTAVGRARTATVALRGSGDVHGDRLMTNEATISLMGSGDVAIGAQRQVTGSLMGSGDITVTGPATCTIAKRGSGTVRCR